jgi:hypothetical protein
MILRKNFRLGMVTQATYSGGQGRRILSSRPVCVARPLKTNIKTKGLGAQFKSKVGSPQFKPQYCQEKNFYLAIKDLCPRYTK